MDVTEISSFSLKKKVLLLKFHWIHCFSKENTAEHTLDEDFVNHLRLYPFAAARMKILFFHHAMLATGFTAFTTKFLFLRHR